MVRQIRRAQRENSLDLLLAGAVRGLQVQVDPVLPLLAVANGNEQQHLTAVARGDQAFLVAGLVRVAGILNEVQHLRPEQGSYSSLKERGRVKGGASWGFAG